VVGGVANAVDRVFAVSGFRDWPNRDLDDGRLLALEPLLFGDWRLHVVGRGAFASTAIYDYPAIAGEAAWDALNEWDGNGDPPRGWVRTKPSDRRRTDGDPEKEYVEP